MSYSELKLVQETEEQFKFFVNFNIYVGAPTFFVLQKSDITQGNALQLRGVLQQQLPARKLKIKERI
jgi:hypothetical protein